MRSIPRRIGASALFALVSCLSQADLHLVIPSEGPPPLYFSSTNARISARAWLGGTSLGFESFRLTLNGEVVSGKTFTEQERARRQVVDSYDFYVQNPNGEGDVGLLEAHMPIWGDRFTKLKGV